MSIEIHFAIHIILALITLEITDILQAIQQSLHFYKQSKVFLTLRKIALETLWKLMRNFSLSLNVYYPLNFLPK